MLHSYYNIHSMKEDIYLFSDQINMQLHFENLNSPLEISFIFKSLLYVFKSFFILILFLRKVLQIVVSLLFICSFLLF